MSVTRDDGEKPQSSDDKRRATEELERRLAQSPALAEDLARHRQGLPVRDPVLAGFLRYRERRRQKEDERRRERAEDERNRKLIEAIGGLREKQETVLALAQSGAKDRANRQHAAIEATKQREAVREKERAEWDRLYEAMLQGDEDHTRREQAEIILKRRLGAFSRKKKTPPSWLTFRAIYDRISAKENGTSSTE